MSEIKRSYSVYSGDFTSLIFAAVVNKELCGDLLSGKADLSKFTLTPEQEAAVLSTGAEEDKSKNIGEFTHRVLTKLNIAI